MEDGVREAKAHLDLNLLGDVKVSKVGFYSYSSRKRKTRENESQVLNGEGDQLEHDMEKVEIINVFSISAFFLHKKSLHELSIRHGVCHIQSYTM